MFTEILRIKPKLDAAGAKQMELSLSQRFGRVTKRFGAGFKAALKGTVIGIGLGFLAKLLNPLEKLEERVKAMLAEGSDLQDLADEFGTSPGKMRRLQDVSSSLGVKPEELNTLMTQYAKAIETAKDEFRAQAKDPSATISEASNAVRNFMNDKDIADSFVNFTQAMKGMGAGRTAIEKEVFGGRLHGGARRLVEADYPGQFKKLNEPSEQKLNQSINKIGGLAARDRVLETKNGTRDLVGMSSVMNTGMIESMQAAKAREEAKERAQLANYADMRKAANTVEKIAGILEKVSELALKGLGKLEFIVDWLIALPKQGWWVKMQKWFSN